MHQASSLFTALLSLKQPCPDVVLIWLQPKNIQVWPGSNKRDLGNLADFTCFRNHMVAHNVKKLVKPIINDSPHLLILCVIKDKQQSTLLLHLLTQCVFALGSDASNGTLSYHIHAGIAREFLHCFLSFTACFLHTCSNIQLLHYSLNFFSGTKTLECFIPYVEYSWSIMIPF